MFLSKKTRKVFLCKIFFYGKRFLLRFSKQNNEVFSHLNNSNISFLHEMQKIVNLADYISLEYY